MTEAMVAAAIPDLRTQYLAATRGGAFAERSDLGRLRIGGKDAGDLLHRLSTNAIKGLEPGQGNATVFTTNKGRILDLALVHRLDEGYLLHVAAERTAALAAWIDRYTFREEVAVEDWSVSHRSASLAGPAADAVAARLAGAAAIALGPHGIATFTAGGATAWLARTFPLAGAGYLVTAPAGAWDAVRAAVLESPAGDVTEIDAAGLEILRVVAGLPAPGRELTEEFNPWEARLGDAIALDKGCYVGQEVIARLNTYKKVSKYLVHITATGAPPPAGAAVRRGPESIGTITSAVAIPDGGGRMAALAYVRDEEAVAGREVTIDAPGGALPATIEGVAR